jgi:hypothetical protein
MYAWIVRVCALFVGLLLAADLVLPRDTLVYLSAIM